MPSNYVIAGIDASKQTNAIKLTIAYVDLLPEHIHDDRKEFPTNNWIELVIEKLDGSKVTNDFSITINAGLLLHEAKLGVSVEKGVLKIVRKNTIQYMNSPRPSAPIPIPMPLVKNMETRTPWHSPDPFNSTGLNLSPEYSEEFIVSKRIDCTFRRTHTS